MGYNKKHVRFHFSKKVKESIEKSKHNVGIHLKAYMKVLTAIPDHGVVIPKRRGLRKSRIKADKFGKRGGYRLIYKRQEIDEIIHIAFLELFFKRVGKKEDLSDGEYKQLIKEAEVVLSNVIDFDWEDGPSIPGEF